VTVADLVADNGVVHVIDAVLLPPSAVSSAMDNLDIKILPNPAADFIQINLKNGNQQIDQIRLVDVNGRTLKVWNQDERMEWLNVSSVQSGHYFLLLQVGGKIYQHKVVIQH